MSVDETGQDEQARVVVDDRAWRGARQDVARFSDGFDQTPGNEHGAVLDEGIGARAALSRIVVE